MSRAVPLLSGLLGGLVAVVVGAILISAGVIDTGTPTREIVRQEPVTRPASDEGEGLTVNEIYDRAAPGVVFISARGVGGGESPFGLPQREGTATGSGFVLDREGYVLTNAHVVEGAREVQVHFEQRGDEIDARVVGRDPSTDLALLKLPDNHPKLRPIPLGNSRQAKVGDPVIAIGNPFGLERTVTTGIVSALQRQIDAPNQFTIDNVIQTDASINPGNSGGPLLDAAGRVVGINAQIATGGQSGGSVGIGFAVPVNTAKQVVPELKRSGRVDRAYLGITTAPISGRIAEELNLPVQDGALVQEVVPGGPADRAGLRAGRTRTEEGLTIGGDIIVRVDGQDVKRPEDVAAAIGDNRPGQTLAIDLLRRGERETVQARLGKRPAETPQALRRQQQPGLP
jgi:S1-C subfamily serine protease